MSTLLKWAQNSTQSKWKQSSGGGSSANSSSGSRSWIHPPDALQKGHIAYLVKFMGNTTVDQPKGIEVVKEGIRKLQFNAQLRKAETGAKSHRKVELTISVDGVAIQEPRTHAILHQFPLHRISYCADDKGEKRFFSFIAKQPNPDGSAEDKHECFVFVSDKLAEEITLTIGQAFELAYKRFLDTSGKDLEAQRRAILNQQRIKRLETENNIYKQRLLEICQFVAIKPELDSYLRRHELKNILELPVSNAPTTSSPEYTLMSSPSTDSDSTQVNGVHKNNSTEKLLDVSFNSTDSNHETMVVPPIPPRRTIDLMGTSTPPLNNSLTPAVGTRLEGLLLNEFDSDQDFDPRSFESNNVTSATLTTGLLADTNGNASSPPLLAPPPKTAKRQKIMNNGFSNNSPMDLFGSAPFNPTTPPGQSSFADPFEMGDFSNLASQQDLENAIGLIDKRILEMKDGFSRGLSFGKDDFSLESLDPLKN